MMTDQGIQNLKTANYFRSKEMRCIFMYQRMLEKQQYKQKIHCKFCLTISGTLLNQKLRGE